MNFKNKKILILGLGLNQGGVGAAKFFAKQAAEVRATDLKDGFTLKSSIDQLKEFENIEFILGKHRYQDIDWADLIIRNPALKPDNGYLAYAKEKGKQVELDMGIFLQFVDPKQIIGVTGSKGKSTTASLIYYALKDDPRFRADNGVILAGNIGKSVLDSLELIKGDTFIILELSSFQLEAFNEHKISPNIAVITNIFPEHLNYYSKFEDYIDAKRIIALYQTNKNYLYLNQEDQILTSKEFLEGLNGQIIFYSSDQLPPEFIPTLIGSHNKTSYVASLKIAEQLGVKKKDALSSMNKFQGADYRLQYVKDSRGIKIYNDSAATNPHAAIAALKALPNSILVAGGMNKNLNYKEFAKAIDKYAKCVVFLEGDATDEIKKHLKDKHKIMGTYNNLEHLLKNIKMYIKKGDTILFAPGATSFNLFQNEFDRGKKFNEAIEEVFK